MKKMLIVGGSDAGISAALRIKELDLQAKVCESTKRPKPVLIR